MSVSELRIAITAEHYERLVKFYRDGLGLDPGDMWADHGQGQVLHAGRGTIEVLDSEHSQHVDNIEVGEQVSGQIRFAFQVPDIHQAIKNALTHGAKQMHEPVMTPWGDLNVRIESPDGFQITLFQVKTGA